MYVIKFCLLIYFSVSAQPLVMVNTIVTPISHVPWTQKTFDGYSMTAATLSNGCTSTSMNCCDGTGPSLDSYSFSVQPLHAARVGLVIMEQNTASIRWQRPQFASFDTTPLCCIIPSANNTGGSKIFLAPEGKSCSRVPVLAKIPPPSNKIAFLSFVLVGMKDSTWNFPFTLLENIALWLWFFCFD